jgi:hypothetical protein
MLVKVIDKKGGERFLNAMYVRTLIPKGPNETDIELGGMSSKIRVKEAAESVAMTLNAAMPNSFEALIAAEQQSQNEQNAALIAVIG